ncbi:aspartate/glutamate racemase family protein, partial [Gluconobacter kondonii]
RQNCRSGSALMPAHFSHRILLINPNSSTATTQMMLRIGRVGLDEGSELVGVTAKRAPRMILTPSQLAAAAEEVVEMATAGMADCNGLIVSAFGDPGLNIIRKRSPIPATGLCEASMLEAAAGGRRFGVATVTPDLIPIIDQRAASLGLGALYTGVRCTHDDPTALTADSDRLNGKLGEAVEECLRKDDAQAVIIGGGPLGQAAVCLGV